MFVLDLVLSTIRHFIVKKEVDCPGGSNRQQIRNVRRQKKENSYEMKKKSELSYPFHAIDLSTVHRCARIALSYQLMCLLLFLLSGWCFDIRTEFGPQTGFTPLISVRSLSVNEKSE